MYMLPIGHCSPKSWNLGQLYCNVCHLLFWFNISLLIWCNLFLLQNTILKIPSAWLVTYLLSFYCFLDKWFFRTILLKLVGGLEPTCKPLAAGLWHSSLGFSASGVMIFKLFHLVANWEDTNKVKAHHQFFFPSDYLERHTMLLTKELSSLSPNS